MDGCQEDEWYVNTDSSLYRITDFPTLPTVRLTANNTVETQDRFSDSIFTKLIINFSASNIIYRMEIIDAGKFYHFSITESRQLYDCVLGGVGGSHVYTYHSAIIHFCIKTLWNLSENWDSNNGSLCSVRPGAAKGGYYPLPVTWEIKVIMHGRAFR